MNPSRSPRRLIETPQGMGGVTSALDPRLYRIARAATVALYDELELFPKPGLVSFVDNGSHSDMDATTFMRSLFALRHYFVRIAMLGASGARFAVLEQAGIAAEARMMQATQGVNTHRGAVFSLGLLCAAAGRLVAGGSALEAGRVRASLVDAWGAELAERSGRRRHLTASALTADAHAMRSAGDEAAAGLPVLFEVAWPALQAALADGLDWRHARLQVLLQIVAVLDDTNLLRRGGVAGLRFAQNAAREWIEAGGARRAGAVARAELIHRSFVAQRLSPGGAADLLAAACWLHRSCR